MSKMEPVNRHYVKTVVLVFRVQPRGDHIGLSSQFQPPLLAVIDKLVSSSEPIGLSELDFNKNQRLPLSCNNIQFTTANTVISRQNPISLHPEPAG